MITNMDHSSPHFKQEFAAYIHTLIKYSSPTVTSGYFEAEEFTQTIYLLHRRLS